MIHAKTLLFVFVAGLALPATPAFPGSQVDEDVMSDGGRFKVRPILRLNLDAASVADDNGKVSAEGAIRRLRMGAVGSIGDKVRFRIEREVSGDGGWRNTYIAYRPSPNWDIRVGNIIAPVSLEDMQGASDQSLAERSLANALAPGFSTGLQLSNSGRRHSLTVGYFGPALRDDNSGPTAEGYGIASRGTWLAVDRDRLKVHVGAGVEHRSNLDGGRDRVSARASGPYGPVVVRTPALTNVDTRTTASLEGAVLRGPIAVQAQYITTDLRRIGGQYLRYSGGYIQGAWMIKGGNYRYDRSHGMPQATDRDHGRGYEALGRVSFVDLNSHDVTGGHASAVEVGGAVHMNDRVTVTSTVGLTKYRVGRSDVAQTSAVWVTRLSAKF